MTDRILLLGKRQYFTRHIGSRDVETIGEIGMDEPVTTANIEQLWAFATAENAGTTRFSASALTLYNSRGSRRRSDRFLDGFAILSFAVLKSMSCYSLLIDIQTLFDDDGRTFAHLDINAADILADDAKENRIQADTRQDEHRGGGKARGPFMAGE